MFRLFAWRLWLTRKKWTRELYGDEPQCRAFCPTCQYIEICVETNEHVYTMIHTIN